VAAREATQNFHSSDSQLRTGSEDPSGDDHPQCVTASWKPPRSASGPDSESHSAVPVCRPLPRVASSPDLKRPAWPVRTIALVVRPAPERTSPHGDAWIMPPAGAPRPLRHERDRRLGDDTRVSVVDRSSRARRDAGL